MATQQPDQNASAQQNENGGRPENAGNRSTQNTSAPNEKDESISTAGDYALGKGSKTEVRKDEKESNDSYDHGRQS